VAHACNPSYSGGRDQEDPSSRSARAKNLHKKGLVEWLKMKALSSSSSTAKKKKGGGKDESSHEAISLKIKEDKGLQVN
jgi:hypothetical protein